MPRLSIDIEAKFAQVLDSFGRIERQAATSMQRIERAAAGVNAALGAIGVGLSIAAVVSSFKSAVDQMAALDDAAEQTGASVESLSSLLNTLKPSGIGLDQIVDVAGKLTKSMGGAGESGKRAAEAFQKLGVQTDIAGKLRPIDDVLKDVADSLSKYADGTNKVLIAQALFGKSGAQYLSLLKDLAEAQKVAGDVTTEQAAAAEKLQKEIGKLTVQLDKLKRELTGPIIEALNDFLERFNKLREVSKGNWLDQARIGIAVSQYESAGKAVDALTAKIAAGEKLLNDLDDPNSRKGNKLAAQNKREELAQLRLQLEYAKEILRQDTRRLNLPDEGGDAGKRAGQNRFLQQAPRITGESDKARQIKAQVSEAERLLESLQNQLDTTRNLTREQEILGQIGRGTIEGLTPALEQQILLAAVKIDKVRAEIVEQERLKRVVEEMTRDEEKLAEAMGNALKPDVSGFENVLKLIQEIRKTAPDDRLLDASLEAAYALRNSGVIVDEAELDAVIQKLYGVSDAADVAQDQMARFGDLMTSAFEDAIFAGDKLSDILKGLAEDIAKLVLRQQLLNPIADMLGGTFDASKSGGTIAGQLRSLLGFAEGGVPPVGQWSVVGEKGAELIKPISPVRVIPNDQIGAMGGSGAITVTQNITYGGNDRAGALQLAAMVKADTIRSIREAQARGVPA